MLLKAGELLIRNAGAADAGQLAKWWNDGTIMAHAGFPKGIGTTAAEVAAGLEQDRDDTRRRLIIEVGGRAVGEMNYCNMGSGTAEIGIKICDFSLHNKGLGKILLSMLISSLFSDLGYTKIVLDTNGKNKRAQHVYETLGFRRTGVRENSWKDQLGEWQTAVDYELTPENFISFLPKD